MIGSGKVSIKGKKVSYRGSFPDVRDGDNVVILREDDLERIISTDELALLTRQFLMPKKLFTNEVIDGETYESELPDEISHTTPKGETTKLFLDRHLYSLKPKEMIWIRYVSVSQSLEEEKWELKRWFGF